MYNDKTQSNYQPITATAVDFDEYNKNHNQQAIFNNRNVKSHKASVFMYLTGVVIGLGVGVVVGLIVQPLISSNWSQTHLDEYSVCYTETEARINAYDNQMIKASVLSGLFAALVPTLTLCAYHKGSK